MKEMLKVAIENNYAVGQFNINNFQWAEAILRGAEEEKSPVILASSDRIVDYLGGFKLIASTVENMVREMVITVPVVLHLDHGLSVERCKEAVDAGYSSVMFDGSKLSIEENIRQTKEVVTYAHKNGISVEAEVGSVGGTEDGIVGGIRYADSNECLRLVQETDVDALAAALGSVHGPYKGEPKLGFAEMEEISELIGIPLVLHGGSGIPEHQIKKSIELGHAKINVNTECNQVWAKTVREILTNDQELYNPQSILVPGMEAITEVVKEKMRLFGSSNQAC
ncbi:class II fructose-1,6-bisphosphate aldolase [Oceanobacillus sp. 143]|uniref:Fructose-1,6-bisphosphate aldolase, class II n=2 Tax=Oceanobacillus zhaokaii TaxID=2052660 RepID=A0A345PMI1_9BACI|nr:fructose-1,6-bisphosphate aldolase, class II [Oceanobacillus zhaokaii]QGS69966.1 class II fructose-1,6-bisphosphate aldolase [Oceanobacillus sp. 143]